MQIHNADWIRFALGATAHKERPTQLEWKLNSDGVPVYQQFRDTRMAKLQHILPEFKIKAQEVLELVS